MAKFSGNIYCDLDKKEQKEEIVKVLPMLQEMMSKSDFEKLEEDYHSSNTDIPFWKFVFDNVEVKYVNKTENLLDDVKGINIMRKNFFIQMTNDQLEKCYRLCILFECKKDIPSNFQKLINNYKIEVGDKVAFPILKDDLLHVIVHRWIEQNKVLKNFSRVINNYDMKEEIK